MTLGDWVNVVTVCYNAENSIERTINSVHSQTYSNINYILVDGASSDKTMEVVEKCRHRIDSVISEVDRGIYDAMNKGLNISKPGWVVFMNAGDEFSDPDVISEVIEHLERLPDVSLVYGDKLVNGEVVQAWPLNYLKKGIIMACHQSMFFKVCDLRYDTSMKIYSDYDFVCQYLSKNHTRPSYFPRVMSNYEGGGVSSFITFQKRLDKYRAVFRHFGCIGLIRAFAYKISEV